MTRVQRYSLLLLRLSLGWLFLYAGIVKVVDPEWTAAGFLAGAKTFPAFFHWLATPGILPVIDALNAWGLTLLGVALILGVAVRLASGFGILLMVLYYLAPLEFPHPDPFSYLVDEHIIYIVGLLIVGAFHAGRIWGLGHFIAWLPFLRRFRRTLIR